MASALPAAEPLPMDRAPGCPFDPPPELAKLRAEQPVSRMLYPDGHVGWLVTSHELVRAVLADPRFSARSELRHFPLPGPSASGPALKAPPGIFTAMDPPEHTRYRHPLVGQFTVRRMRQLTPRIQQIAADHLDVMEKHGPSMDLMPAYAMPIPALAICELLGVPYEDRDQFTARAGDMMSLKVTREQRIAGFTSVQQYLTKLVAAKRAEPTDDLLSGLTTTDLTDEELINVGAVLLGAGHETTANMISLGAYVLLKHPDQRAALKADPELAVEELLRYLSIIPATIRAALEDVELGGQPVKAGDSVTLSVPAANRDPAHFPDPDTLDLGRRAAGHVAFGHGIHQCIGQQLARIELHAALPMLFDRFPNLRLAVPEAEIPLKTDMLIYGVHSLPVTW